MLNYMKMNKNNISLKYTLKYKSFYLRKKNGIDQKNL